MVLDGEYDSKKGGLVYTGSKISEIYGDDGELEKVVEYDDATGLIYFGQDGSLYWDDEKENLGKGCVFVRADEEKTDDESDSQGNDINNEGYAGIWLSQPSGQEGYNIYAEGIWIKSYTDTSVEYETAYFIGKPINSTGIVCKDYTWEIDRHTSGTAEIVDSDVEGIKCFFADDENVYLASDKLYYGEYLDEDLGLIKTGFQSLDFCIYYYNCDYGYCYNNVDYVLRITAMNDALLYVEFDGADGDWGEWDFNTQYDEIGKDGELIYYYGKDFVMSYYPNEHRIHIETSNDIYQGDYICTNI